MKIKAPNLKHYFPGNEVEIDKSLYDVIIKFNQLGYTTYSCCSGLPEDHTSKDDRNCGFYVSFAADIPDEYVVLASNQGFKCDLWRGRPWIGTSDRKIKNVNDRVRELILLWDKQLNRELKLSIPKKKCKKKTNIVSFVRELFRPEATT